MDICVCEGGAISEALGESGLMSLVKGSCRSGVGEIGESVSGIARSVHSYDRIDDVCVAAEANVRMSRLNCVATKNTDLEQDT